MLKHARNIEETMTATGRWREILRALNIIVPDDARKHGACPICGKGRHSHRFRFDDKDGFGTWICSQCGAGNGYKLIKLVCNVSYEEAHKMVCGVLGLAINTDTKKEDKTRSFLKKIFNGCVPVASSNKAGQYLIKRGIGHRVKDLYYKQDCYCAELKKNIDAMVGIVRSENGNAITVHRTYLSPEVSVKKKLAPSLAMLAGSAIRLYNVVDGTIGVAEGIETAMSAHKLFGVSVWSTISATLMESFVPPPEVSKVIIYSDNDSNLRGQAAAYKLANKLTTIRKLDVNIMIPPEKDMDWNDYLNQEKEFG